MKPSKKIQKILEIRQKGREKIVQDNANNTRFNPLAYKIPGSRNPKKCR